MILTKKERMGEVGLIPGGGAKAHVMSRTRNEDRITVWAA